MPFESTAPRLGQVGSLDGLRGICVLMIVLFHIGGEKLASFSAAVDVFFVVSGFLITTLLLQEHRRNGSIALRSFYSRRALRLLPPLYPVLAYTFLASLFVKNGRFVGEALKEIGSAFFYMYHVVFAVGLTKFDSKHDFRFLTHLWSLSVEEHFYLVIAALILFIVRRDLVRLFAAAAVIFVLVGAASRLTGHFGPLTFWLQRPDHLLVGVLVSLVNANLPTQLSPTAEKRLKTLGILGAAVMAFAMFASTSFANKLGVAFRFSDLKIFDEMTIGQSRFGLTWTRIGYTMAAWGVAPLLLAVVRCSDWWMTRLLTLRWLRGVGRQTYAIYIWHVPILVVVAERADAWSNDGGVGKLGVAAVAVGSVAIAFLSHRFVEVPAMRIKRRFASDPDSIDVSRR